MSFTTSGYCLRTARILACAVSVGAIYVPAHAQATFRQEDSKLSSEVASAFTVAKVIREAVVTVLDSGKVACLGVIVSGDGLVLTKYSDLPDAPYVQLAGMADPSPAYVAAFDVDNDLALLKVPATGLTAVVFNGTRRSPVGTFIATVDPREKGPTAVGVISTPPRRLPSAGGMLGVMLEESDGGVKVRSVSPNSAAEKAKLQPGDVILKINGTLVTKREDLTDILRSSAPRTVVKLTLRRGDEEVMASPLLDKREEEKSFRSELQNTMGGQLSKKRTGFPMVVQHDAMLRPSQVGGPLIDLEGYVVGLNVARSGRVESYAIPAESLAPILAKLIDTARKVESYSSFPTDVMPVTEDAPAPQPTTQPG